MMRVVRGDRLDALLDAMLGELAARPLAPPSREIVVLHGRGLDRWISQQAALRCGGWGFVETLYPRPFLLRAFAAVCDGAVPRRVDDDGWMRMELELRIAGLLPELVADPRFAPVAAAIGAGAPEASTDDGALECAPAIAEVLDRCVQHRVDMVERWMAGAEPAGPGDEPWLAELWRRAAHGAAPTRLLTDRLRFIERCRGGTGTPRGLPPRASVFGVSTLAPSFVELLEALARRIEITVYALDPSGGHRGHPLSRAWGIESSEFGSMLAELERGGRARLDRCDSGSPADRSALALLQAAVRGQATEPPGGSIAAGAASSAESAASSAEGAAPSIGPSDDSLQLLPSRGALREVERVHDAIVRLLERDRALEPRDVAILTPDLERYGPIVEAVFGARRDDRARPVLPFTVADRDRATLDAAETLAALVETALGRIGRGEVVERLSQPAIGEAFGIGPLELDRIVPWFERAEIRWGLDAEHRAQHGRAGETIGTWQWGLDRLRLGAMLPEGADGAMGATEPVAPLAAAELGDLDRLDAVQSFLDALAIVARRAADALPIAADVAPPSPDGATGGSTDGRRRHPGDRADDWIGVVERLAEATIWRGGEGDRERTAGMAALRARMADLRRAAVDAGFAASRRVRARTAARFMLERLRADHPGRALLASGVTVAALQPMRSIPFRVIALVGMAEGVMPRRRRAPSFDLVARERRLGDRDARLDDRQVMLETLMAASRALIISWPGIDATTGLESPPSVLVGELMDAAPDVRLIPDPWDDASGDGGADPGATGDGPADPGAAGADRRDIPSARPRTISLDSLRRFWRSPAEAFLAARGVRIEWSAREVDDEDPVDREYERDLMTAALGDERAWIDERRRDPPPAPVLEGRGWVPRGPGGRRLIREIEEDAQAWLSDARALVTGLAPGARLPATERAFSLDLEIDHALAPSVAERSVVLDAMVPVIEGVGPLLVVARKSAVGAAEMLHGWMRLLSMAASGAAPRGLIVIGRTTTRDGSGRPRELEARFVESPGEVEARRGLVALVSLALEGEARALAFMPEASFEFAHHCVKRNPEPGIALAKAREQFFNEAAPPRPVGEAFHPAVRIVFGPERFFEANGGFDFERLSTLVAIPIRRAFGAGRTRRDLRSGLDGAPAPTPTASPPTARTPKGRRR